MANDEFDVIREALDAALKDVRPMMGIVFGEELYREFRKRGWITEENFGLEPYGFKDPQTVYDETHHAWESLEIPPLEYRIGRDA